MSPGIQELPFSDPNALLPFEQRTYNLEIWAVSVAQDPAIVLEVLVDTQWPTP